jgi:lipoprotein-anchoring transpeptidase ErfK/SrfK
MGFFSSKMAALAAVICALSHIPAYAGSKILVVDFSEATLSLYEEGMSEPIARYPVVVPRKGDEPEMFPIRGQVVRVERNPYWYPTGYTKETFLEKRNIRLPDAVPPGDPLNAMGTMKIRVQFSGPIKPTVRIHGTNEPHIFKLPPEKRHRSSGCIRMLNQDTEELGTLIEASPSPVLVVLQE